MRHVPLSYHLHVMQGNLKGGDLLEGLEDVDGGEVLQGAHLEMFTRLLNQVIIHIEPAVPALPMTV